MQISVDYTAWANRITRTFQFGKVNSFAQNYPYAYTSRFSELDFVAGCNVSSSPPLHPCEKARGIHDPRIALTLFYFLEMHIEKTTQEMQRDRDLHR